MASLLLLSCTPDLGVQDGSGTTDGPETPTPTPGPAVEGNLTGTVTDSSTGKPIAGVSVSDGYSVCVTDAEGKYSIQIGRGVYKGKIPSMAGVSSSTDAPG